MKQRTIFAEGQAAKARLELAEAKLQLSRLKDENFELKHVLANSEMDASEFKDHLAIIERERYNLQKKLVRANTQISSLKDYYSTKHTDNLKYIADDQEQTMQGGRRVSDSIIVQKRGAPNTQLSVTLQNDSHIGQITVPSEDDISSDEAEAAEDTDSECEDEEDPASSDGDSDDSASVVPGAEYDGGDQQSEESFEGDSDGSAYAEDAEQDDSGYYDNCSTPHDEPFHSRPTTKCKNANEDHDHDIIESIETDADDEDIENCDYSEESDDDDFRPDIPKIRSGASAGRPQKSQQPTLASKSCFKRRSNNSANATLDGFGTLGHGSMKIQGSLENGPALCAAQNIRKRKADSPISPKAVKRGRGTPWTDEEKNALVEIVRTHVEGVKAGSHNDVHDVKLWVALRGELQRIYQIERGAQACRMVWNRELRESSGIDERRHPDPTQLATSLQVSKRASFKK
jgi:hypothetical protein